MDEFASISTTLPADEEGFELVDMYVNDTSNDMKQNVNSIIHTVVRVLELYDILSLLQHL